MVRATRVVLVFFLMLACRKEGARSEVGDGSAAGPATPSTPGGSGGTGPDVASGRERPPSGCPDASPPAAPPPPDAPAANTERSAEAGPALPPGEPPGHARLPELPSDAARRHNANGLEAHRAGDYARSAQRFAGAVKAAPGYDLARYNLACALARLGRHAEAAAELETLLRRDLPSHAPRLAVDPDLESLRAAPEGLRLNDLVPALRAAWRSAVASGIPVVAPVAGAWQAGAYRLAEKRFLPVTPWNGKSIGAGIDPAAGHAFVLEGKVDWDGYSEYFEATVRVYSVATFEEVAVVPVPGRAYRIEVALDPAGVSFDWGDQDEHRMTGWKRVAFGGGGEPASAERPQGLVFGIDPHGTTLEVPSPPGVELKGNRAVLPGRAEPVGLGPGHAAADLHALSVSPDGRWLAVVSSRSSCDYGDEGEIHHFIDLVDVPAGTVRRLSEGEGAGYARFDDAGGLLVQTGTTLRRWAAPDAAEPETLLDGVMLVVPLDAPECGV